MLNAIWTLLLNYILLCSMSYANIYSQTNAWTNVGPTGISSGKLGRLGDTLYVLPQSDTSGVGRYYYTTDQGNRWKRQVLPGNAALLGLFKHKDLLIAYDHHNLYVSADDGNLWIQKILPSRNGNPYVNRIFHNNNSLYATSGTSLYISTDAGDGWTQSFDRFQYEAGNPVAAEGLRLLTTISGVPHYSLNHGKTWELCELEASQYELRFGDLYKDESGVYALASDKGRAIVTIDGGRTWEEAFKFVQGSWNFRVHGERMLMQSPGSASVDTSRLQYSSNSGKTWKAISVPGTISSLEIDYDAIYYADRWFVWRSTDEGETWQKSVGGLYALGTATCGKYLDTIRFYDSGYLFSPESYSLWRADAMLSYHKRSRAYIHDSAVIAWPEGDDALYYAYMTGNRSASIRDSSINYISDVAWYRGNYMFASQFGLWKKKSLAVPGLRYSLQSAENSRKVAAGPRTFYTGAYGVVVSTSDGGTIWQKVENLPVYNVQGVQCFANEASAEVVYVHDMMPDSVSHIYESRDSGKTWLNVFSIGPGTYIQSFTYDGRYLIVAHSGKIWIGAPGGEFQLMSNQMEFSTITSLNVIDGMIYANTPFFGAWATPVVDTIFSSVDEPLVLYAGASCLPNPASAFVTIRNVEAPGSSENIACHSITGAVSYIPYHSAGQDVVLEVAGLDAGVWMVSLLNMDHQQVFVKFIIRR